MKIAISADHRGAELRVHLMQWLQEDGHDVVELRPCTGPSSDYPDGAYSVARRVADGKSDAGILICGSGIGMSIAANKVRGIRAALVHDEVGAEFSRRHNDANVLCLPADMLGQRIVDRIVSTWLTTAFDGGRHTRRIRKIDLIEQDIDPTEADNCEVVTESQPKVTLDNAKQVNL